MVDRNDDDTFLSAIEAGRSIYPHAPWNDNRETSEPCDPAPSRFRHTPKLRASSLFRFRQMALEVILTLLALLGFSSLITKTRKRKLKHEWACHVMHQLLGYVGGDWEFAEMDTGMDPHLQPSEWIENIKTNTALEVSKTPTLEEEIASESETDSAQESQQTPGAGTQPQKRTKRGVNRSVFLIAGKKGVKEMVNAILEAFPTAIRDKDLEHKNVMLLAAEHRQTDIFMLLQEKNIVNWLGQVDVKGNSILHLAAQHTRNEEMLIPGAALQMQREIKWFQFVKEKLPRYFSKLQNYKGQTAMEIFTETHKELAQERAKWLTSASQSCSVVATLITTVAFATIAAVPGGVHDHGDPVFQGKLAFNVFSASSFIALCFSSISVVMFLSILTSPYQDLDYSNHLPRKLIYGLASLFISIAAMFLSFFTGDLFVLDTKIKYMAYPIFILTLGVALPGFPLCYEFVKETVSTYPSRLYPHKLSF